MAFGVTCPTCGKAFSITDEIYQRKVASRVVTIKCKQCQAGIRVDATTATYPKISAAAKGAPAEDHKAIETTSVAPSVPPAPRVRQATLIGGVVHGAKAAATAAAAPTPRVAPAPPVAQPPETLWAVEAGDGQDRELTLSELGRDIERGSIPPTTLVWREGMAEWLEVQRVPELAGFVKKASLRKAAPAARPAAAAQAPKAAAPAATKPIAPAVAAPKAAAAQVTKPAVATPAAKTFEREPADIESAAPNSEKAATLPRPFVAEPPTQPRPFVAEPPPQVAPPPPQVVPPPPQVVPPPPQVVPPPPQVAPPPPPAAAPWQPEAPPAPFVPGALVAAAPAPAARAPMPIAPAVQTFATPNPVSASTDFELPKTRSKAPLVIALVGVVGAVAAGIFLLKGSGESTGTRPAADVPSTPVAAVTPTTASTTATAPTATGTSEGTPAGTDASAAETTPGAGFAELFASGARQAQGTQISARFDAAVAKKALAQVVPGLGACKEPGGPRGKVDAIVAFAPTGKVSSVTISEAPFAGTSTGTCLGDKLKQAAMPPFRGLPGTVSQPIYLK